MFTTSFGLPPLYVPGTRWIANVKVCTVLGENCAMSASLKFAQPAVVQDVDWFESSKMT